ncbi:MAG: 5-(carboxyamino)imidazole ribonucleotide mutase [Phycisphaerales bacterium]|nr:5-(carboxyamino)imidazole ribonucleotide mutase [Phycisphaerales bacterium]
MNPLVIIVMGSKSDWETMSYASETLDALGVPHDIRVLSAHRTPDQLETFLAESTAKGAQVVIAGAGGAAHLAGVCAAKTTLPVLGVPMKTDMAGGLDSLLSTVQMPAGIPVATFATGRAGATNAAIFAAMILGRSKPEFDKAVRDHRDAAAAKVLGVGDPRKG